MTQDLQPVPSKPPRLHCFEYILYRDTMLFYYQRVYQDSGLQFISVYSFLLYDNVAFHLPSTEGSIQLASHEHRKSPNLLAFRDGTISFVLGQDYTIQLPYGSCLNLPFKMAAAP